MIIKSYLLWGIFVLSGILLTVTLFRQKFAFQWIGSLCLNVALAAFLLYILNLLQSYTHLDIPINGATVGVVTFLGIPGLMMLAALKLWIV